MTGRDELFLIEAVWSMVEQDLPSLLVNVHRILEQPGKSPASD